MPESTKKPKKSYKDFFFPSTRTRLDMDTRATKSRRLAEASGMDIDTRYTKLSPDAVYYPASAIKRGPTATEGMRHRIARGGMVVPFPPAAVAQWKRKAAQARRVAVSCPYKIQQGECIPYNTGTKRYQKIAQLAFIHPKDGFYRLRYTNKKGKSVQRKLSGIEYEIAKTMNIPTGKVIRTYSFGKGTKEVYGR